MLGLKDEIQEFRDSHGLVVPDHRPTSHCVSGNGLLYTSIYYVLLVLRGEARKPEDYSECLRIFRSCEYPDARGLFNRSPCKKDQNGFDDYIGLVACSWFMNLPIAREIRLFGQDNGWVFNNENPDEFYFPAWFGRYPQLIALVKFCSNKTPSLLQRLWLIFSILLVGTFGKGSTPWILSWLMIETVRHRGGVWEVLYSAWRFKLLHSKYGNMKGVFSEHLGGDHAVTRYCTF